MATTTKFAIPKPTVGGDSDAWGTSLNTGMDTIDTYMLSCTGYRSDGTTVVPMTGPLALAVGSAAAPGLNFNGDTNTGLYWIGADSIGMSLGGTLRTTFATTGITSTGGFSGTTGTFSSSVSCTTLTATGLVLTPATASGGAGLRLPHGTAPSSPTNGDLWTTTSGLYARINGSTTGPFATSAGTTLLVANNLSELTATASTARGNLGLGTASTYATGTSGAVVPLLNGNNTYGGTMTVTGAATFNGNVTLGNAGGDTITVTGTMSGVDLSGQTIGTADVTGDGYLKIGEYYYQWGTTTDATKDGAVVVTLPYTSGTSSVLEGTVQATPRNLTSATNINATISFVSATVSAITFFQSDIASSGTPQGFNWSCWTLA